MNSDNSVKDIRQLPSMKKIQKKKVADSWSPEQEQILKSWAEKGSGWAWLHDQSSRYYLVASNKLAYPSIFLSTIAGTISFSTAGSATELGMYAGYFTAILNITCALLSSFQKFTRSAEKCEIHLQQGKLFSSFCRKITLELALKPEDRRSALSFARLAGMNMINWLQKVYKSRLKLSRLSRRNLKIVKINPKIATD